MVMRSSDLSYCDLHLVCVDTSKHISPMCVLSDFFTTSQDFELVCSSV